MCGGTGILIVNTNMEVALVNKHTLIEAEKIDPRLKAHAEVICDRVRDSSDNQYVGYLFNPANWGDSVKVGLYCMCEDDYQDTHFEYYYKFITNKFYKVIKEER